MLDDADLNIKSKTIESIKNLDIVYFYLKHYII